MAGGGEIDDIHETATATTAAPLLEKVYWEGCPGCAAEKRKEENPGIPYLQFFRIWIIILVSCLPITFIYPFLYFMIRDLHVAKTVEDIGFYGGFVGASYMLGRALTSTVWGMVADRIGRKPVILFGIFSTVVFNTLFGLSTHYWMAITTRFFVGSLNGLLGPIRAYTIEICRDEHQAIGMSLDSTAWAMGLIIGSVIGGYLAQKNIQSYSLTTHYSKGVSVMVYQTFIYPYIERILGPINTSRVATVLSMVLLFTYPPMTHLSRPWLQIVSIVTCTYILQNNSVTQDQRGTANGLATTIMSFFKAFAPAGAGIVFSWAQKRQHAFFFPGDQMVFFMLFVVEFIGLVWTFKPFLAMPEQFSSNLVPHVNGQHTSLFTPTDSPEQDVNNIITMMEAQSRMSCVEV
uniref:Major facilitator superfamily (MFS) profile domain-containing protein n=1 Tax=Leersia perrieri TaxID=77586 RepID=A0A0D9WW66_9ORYZ